ncbi:MAG: mechanosensitive ion channel family protein [Chloroflexi bacterium]|nr:mechanosensitive ion channel family protein [Chloroflexota bacterium]
MTFFQLDQWSALLTAAFIIFGFAVGARLMWWTLTHIVLPSARKSATKLDDLVLEALRVPVSAAIIVLGFVVARSYVYAAFPQWEKYERDFLFIAYATIGYLAVYRLTSKLMWWYLHEKAKETETHIDDHFLPFFRRVMLIVLTLIYFILILNRFGVSVTSLVAALGVTSLAVALAAQSSLSDLISGFLILADQPFRIGDRINIAELDLVGDVVDIGLRSTHILTLDHRMVVVPNTLIANNIIINEAYPDPALRVDIPVGVAYGVDVRHAKAVILAGLRNIKAVHLLRPPEVLFISMGDSALNLEVRCWIDTYSNRPRLIDRINENIYQSLTEAGIEIPFPQRTVWHRLEPDAVEQWREALAHDKPMRTS